MPSYDLPHMFDFVPDGVLLVNREGQIFAANQRARELFNLTPDCVIETVSVTEFLDADAAELVLEELADLLNSSVSNPPASGIRTVEVLMHASRNQELWTKVSLTLPFAATVDTAFSEPAIMLVLSDISQHQQALSELKQHNERLTREVAKISRKRREDARQSQLNYRLAGEQIELARAEKKLADELGSRWRSLTEHASQIVMLLDRKGKILFCNRLMSGDETQGKKSVQDLIPAHDVNLTRRAVEEVLRGQAIKSYEVGGKDGQGNVVWNAISIGPVLPNNGERSESVVLIATDITHRKLAEESLARHQEELAHVSRLASMGALTVELAHELNQPLGVIGFYVGGCIIELEQQDFDLEKIAEAQQKILSETQRAGQITDRILDFLRRREAPRMMTDLNWLLTETLPLAQLEAHKYNVSLASNFSSALPEVKINRVQMQQIVINLVANAVHSVVAARPDKPLVKVSTRLMEGEALEVSVSDNGTGFDTMTSEQLFQPFFTTKEKGTGMGLSVCRTLVELHGGRITASNNPNCGATFSFAIPLYDPERETDLSTTDVTLQEAAAQI